MVWKLCISLGGLLILLDFTNAAKLPLNSVPNSGKQNKPLTNGGAGAIVSSINIPSSSNSIANNNLPSMALQSISPEPTSSSLASSLSPPGVPQDPPVSSSSQQIAPSQSGTLQQTVQPSYQLASPPRSPPPSYQLASAPQMTPPSYQLASVPQMTPPSYQLASAPEMTPSSSQLTSPPRGPPLDIQLSSSGPSLVAFNISQRPPNYSPPPGNANTQSSQISHVTFSQHSGGSSPVTTSLDQVVSNLGTETKPQHISDGVNIVLGGINPVLIANGELQPLSQQINPSGIQHGAIQIVYNNEQNQASQDSSPNLIHHVSAQTGSSQSNEVGEEEEEEEEAPEFDLEAYLAQANLVLNNNANYYSPPPTVQINSVDEEPITEPIAPANEIISAVQPIPSSVPLETLQPPSISSSSSNAQGQVSGETIVIVTTAGNFGADAVHVVSSSQGPQLASSASFPPTQATLVITSGSAQGSSATATSPTITTTLSSNNGTYQLASQIEPHNQAELQTLEVIQPPIVFPTGSATPPNSHVAPITQVQQPQLAQQPAVFPSEEPTSPEVITEPLDQSNMLPPQNYIEAPQSIPPPVQHVPEHQSEVQPLVPVISPVTEEQGMPPTPPEVLSTDQDIHLPPPQSVPPGNQHMPPAPVDSHYPNEPASPEQVPHSEVQQQGIPQNAEMQTFTPVPNDSPPSNIIFEATITNAGHYNGVFNSDTPPPEGVHVPPGYIFVPLSIPPDSEGTLTISAVSLENPHEGATAHYDEGYPPFDVEAYLAQAALMLGSPAHGSKTPGNFQPSMELHDGDTAIHIIDPPSLAHYISVNSGEKAELTEQDSDELVNVEAVTSIGDYEHEPLPIIHSEVQPAQVLVPLLDPSEVDFEASSVLHFYQNKAQLTPSFEESISPVPVIPLVPEHYQESGAHDKHLILPENIVHVFHQPSAHVGLQESEHITALLDDNLNSIQELPLDDLSLLNTSALEALEAESDNSLDHQTLIPVYFVEENSMSSETLPETSESNGDIQWTIHPSPMPIPETQEQNRDDMATERSPSRPIGSLGLIGRPSSMGMAPMHSYTGGKLNPLVGPLSSMSEDGQYVSGSFTGSNSKNQNNGSFIIHDAKNPQNGMMTVMGNTLYNSHVSGDQPTQFTVPANAASFIMPQGQKFPFHFSPPFDSILRPPLANRPQNDGPSGSSSDSGSNTNVNTNTGSGAKPNNAFNNYYYPEDSVRNATFLIQNGMMRPLITPVFLVVNTNSEQAANPSTMGMKVLPSDESNLNSSHKVNAVTFNSENGAEKEMQHSNGTIHLVKRTAPNSKSTVSGGNSSSVELPSSNLTVTNLVSQAQSPSEEPNQVEVAGGAGEALKVNQQKIAEENDSNEDMEEEDDAEEETEPSPLPIHEPAQKETVGGKDKSTPSKTLVKAQNQKAIPPEAPPKKKQPTTNPESALPALQQAPPVLSLIGLPTLPEALNVPGGLGDLISIPEPSINAPTGIIPTIPKLLGDTKGLGKGSSTGSLSKAKPSKKPPQSNPSKGNNNAPQQPQQFLLQQPTNSGPISQPQYQQQQNEMLMEQLHSNQEDMNVMMGGEVSDDYNNKYDGNEAYDDAMDNDGENDDKSNDSTNYSTGNALVSPPTIPAVPLPTIEKALPGKYGNGRPTVVPSLAAFSAPYFSQPPSSGTYNHVPIMTSGTYNHVPIMTSGTHSTNPIYDNNFSPSPDKGCTCNSNNNNNNNSNKYENNNSNPGSGGSTSGGGKHKPPKPNKPKRPTRPNKGDKNPKPKPGEKNADKFKDSDEEEEVSSHMTLVAGLNKPNYSEIKEADKEKYHTEDAPSAGSDNEEGPGHMTLVAVLKKPNYSEIKEVNKEEDHKEDDASTGSDEHDGGAESEIVEERPMIPIKVTFVSNNDSKSTGGPIKVTFVSPNGSKTDSKGPIKVTFVSTGPGVSETEKNDSIKINHASSNHTKSNNTALESSELSQDDPATPPSKPVSTPAKQSQLLTTVKWYGLEIPAINWSYFTDLFNSFFGKNFRTYDGAYTCDELDDEPPILRSELDVDYLCGEEHSRMDTGSQIDSNICNMFCNSNGFYSGVCLPMKSCLCYLAEDKLFGIRLDRLSRYSHSNDTERLPSNSMDDVSESPCQNCSCLKSCLSHEKYIGYCSKSCHCGVPFFNGTARELMGFRGYPVIQ